MIILEIIKFIDTKYILKINNYIKTKIKIYNKNTNNKLEQNNLEDKKNFLFTIK